MRLATKIIGVFGAVGLAMTQIGGCLPRGNLGEGRSFSSATIRLSVDSAGAEADQSSGVSGISRSGSSGRALSEPGFIAGSHQPSLSRDGRYVAFVSFASNLVDGDSNGKLDVFLHDRAEARTERISVDTSGVEADGTSLNPVVSADGRFVLFLSNSTNLRGPQGGFNQDAKYEVYRRDRKLKTTEHVSNDTTPGEGDCDAAVMTPDGDQVIYERTFNDSNNVPSSEDLYVRKRTDAVALQSPWRAARGGDSVGTCPRLSVSGDGNWLVWQSGGAPSQKQSVKAQIWHGNRSGMTLSRVAVSVNATEESQAEPNADSRDPDLSADGRWVVFSSRATDLVRPATTLDRSHVYLRQMLPGPGPTIMATRSATGNESNGDSFRPAVSPDGRYVVYESKADDLVEGDTNQASDIFRWDRLTGRTIRLSVHTEGDQSAPLTFGSFWPAISADGRFVAFASDATNLVADDRNGVRDIFIVGPLEE